jgi:chromosome partitioning protein
MRKAVTIMFTNQKGGVGKTSTCLGLAEAFRYLGKKVLLVDCDPQANTTSSFKVDTDGIATLYDLIVNREPIENCIISRNGIDLLPGDKVLKSQEDMIGPEKITRLQHELKKVKDKYDYILIDTNPGTGFCVKASYAAADGAIIPMNFEKYAIDGLADVMRTMESFRDLNEDFKLYGVLINKLDMRMADQRMADEQFQQLDGKVFHVFRTKIRTDQTIPKAQTRDESIFEDYKGSKAQQDFLSLAEEFEEDIKNG